MDSALPVLVGDASEVGSGQARTGLGVSCRSEVHDGDQRLVSWAVDGARWTRPRHETMAPVGAMAESRRLHWVSFFTFAHQLTEGRRWVLGSGGAGACKQSVASWLFGGRWERHATNHRHRARSNSTRLALVATSFQQSNGNMSIVPPTNRRARQALRPNLASKGLARALQLPSFR